MNLVHRACRLHFNNGANSLCVLSVNIGIGIADADYPQKYSRFAFTWIAELIFGGLIRTLDAHQHAN